MYCIQNKVWSNDIVVKPSFSMVVGNDLLVNDLKILIFLVLTIGNIVLHCHPAASVPEGFFKSPIGLRGIWRRYPKKENPNNMHIFFILFLRREKTSHLQVQTISKILLVLNIALGKNIPRAIYVYIYICILP